MIQIKSRTGNILLELEAETLKGADLTGAHLYKADLSGADLTGADLTGAHLYKAHLYKADLSGAHLSEADLTEADLTEAHLYKADLSGADLTGAHLSEADLTEANLRGADLSFVKGAVGFYLGKHFGYAWKKGEDVVIKIGCREHTLGYWVTNIPEIGNGASYTATEIAVYTKQVKLIGEFFN